MSGFEWTAIALILFGMVIPFWIMVILMVHVVQKAPKDNPSPVQAREYSGLMREFTKIFAKENDGRFNGPSLIACIRDLKKFPEYRDASILLLEEMSITGSGKFDDMARTELKSVEIHLLGLEAD